MTFIYLGIDHVQLAAPEGCEGLARSFFADLLGWEEIEKPYQLQRRGGVWFQCGAHQVHVGVEHQFVPAKKAHPAFRVQHIDDLRNYLLKRNIGIMDDDLRAEEGVRRFYVDDPFGNRLEFLEGA